MVESQRVIVNRFMRLLVLFVFMLSVKGSFAREMNVDSLLQLLETSKVDTLKVRYMLDLSETLGYSAPNKSKNYAQQALELSIKVKYRRGEGISNKLLGVYYYHKSDYEKAMEYFIQALSIFKEIDDSKFAASVYTNIANINIKFQDFESAKENLQTSISLFKKVNSTSGLPFCYQSLASIYYFEQNTEEALKYFEKAIHYARIIDDKHVMAACLNGFAAIHFKNENYRKALDGYNEALELLSEKGDYTKGLSGVYHNIAMTYRKLKEYDNAIETLNIALELAQKAQSNEDIKQAYSELNFTYQEKGDLANALIALEYYTVYDDSVFDETTLNAINEMQEKYKAEERTKEISELQIENDHLAKESTLRKSVLIISIGSFLLLLAIIYVYMRYSRIRQRNRQVELEQKALRAQMNPHFIFNSLNSIQRLYVEGKEDLANDYMADFSSLLRRILENSSMDKVSLKEELRSTTLYLDLEKMRTDDLFVYSFEVDPEIDQLNSYVPPLIFQPFVENAIWHGIVPKNQSGKICIRIRKIRTGELECIISDDGIGIKESKRNKRSDSTESKGMGITANRLGGDQNVVVSELEGGGTEIKLRIQQNL